VNLSLHLFMLRGEAQAAWNDPSVLCIGSVHPSRLLNLVFDS
jgi:hypothetical protein